MQAQHAKMKLDVVRMFKSCRAYNATYNKTEVIVFPSSRLYSTNALFLSLDVYLIYLALHITINSFVLFDVSGIFSQLRILHSAYVCKD